MIPQTIVRAATLRDTIDVIANMRLTMRGQNELRVVENVTGLTVDERFIAALGQHSIGTVALIKAKDTESPALVVAGFIPLRPGVLRTWMLATDEAWDKYGGELTVYTERGIALQLNGARRIETICPDSHELAKAWYPRLGLKQEATLAKYCSDGSDAALFVRVRGDE